MAGDTLSDIPDWRETYAWSLGLQAYVFGFPWLCLSSLRWSSVALPGPESGARPHAAFNTFHHARNLADASCRDGGSPCNDVLHSTAWLDVSKEPVILAHPDMGDRWFSFAIASLDSDNFAYVGSRATGSAPGQFAILGDGWRGDLPIGVTPLPMSRTDSVLVRGRISVRGPSDLKPVHALQDRFRLTPLSWREHSIGDPPRRHDAWKPFDLQHDPLAEWKTINRAMTEDPPEARLAPLFALFAGIHIGHGQDIDALDSASKRGLERAANDARVLLAEAGASGQLGKRVNNWDVPSSELGRAGRSDQFLLRAAAQCLDGVVADDPDEAVCFNSSRDAEGNALEGEGQYRLRFTPGQLPRVNGFWSLSLYDATGNFTANPINRYAIGQRTEGLRQDPDGGLTIQIQGDVPAGDRKSNWLPSPPNGGFSLILRAYAPGPEIVRGNWAPPPVVRVG